jgi:hypothetical protein
MKLEKRSSRGLTYGLAYTYSKAHGDGENGGQEGASLQNPRDRRGSRGLFRFDQTHRIVGNFVWELPGANMKGVAGAIIGGWQANGIVTIASGFPYNIGQGAGELGLPNGSIRPDLIGEAERSEPTRKLWFDPSAFQRVTCQIPTRQDRCHLGSMGYNALRGPGQRNIDFSMYKNFRITERFNLQFRWEAFNFFNTPWFGDPSGISFSNANQLTPDGSRNGEIRGLRTSMRIMQFGLKLRF